MYGNNIGNNISRRDERKYFKKIQFNRMWKWLLYYDLQWKVLRKSWDYFAHERRVMIENIFFFKKKNVSENEHLKRWWYKIRLTFSLSLFPSLKFRIRIHDTEMQLLNMKITWATGKKYHDKGLSITVERQKEIRESTKFSICIWYVDLKIFGAKKKWR